MLRAMVAWVSERWRVKRSSVLLTGLSDGATFTLLTGLAEGAPFTALAPIAGVLHPANAANGNLARAAGKRLYLVHGERDWMFPVETAHIARDRLQDAGAELVYREIADLSHTYPREENARILEWFDPMLSMPPHDTEV
jgi:phospholipase/carboxylesterase